jgi:hypothetical protein
LITIAVPCALTSLIPMGIHHHMITHAFLSDVPIPGSCAPDTVSCVFPVPWVPSFF